MKVSLCKGRFRGIFNTFQHDREWRIDRVDVTKPRMICVVALFKE